MDKSWLFALIAIVAGIVLGSLAAKIFTKFATAPNRPDALQSSATPIASMIGSLCLVIGLMTALGFVKPDALDQMINDFVLYIPRLVSAGIVLILGDVAGTVAGTAAASAVGRSAGPASGHVPTIVKGVIMAFAAILASSQLGVDTTVVNIAVAAILFSLGLAAALLIGLGGRSVSSEIAAGRALKRLVGPGDTVTSDSLAGTVLAAHSTSVELDVGGSIVLVPNSEMLDSTLTVERFRPDPEEAEAQANGASTAGSEADVVPEPVEPNV